MRIPWRLRQLWARFWMTFAGVGPAGRMACWLAAWLMPPYHGRYQLRYMNPVGYVSWKARLWHPELTLGPQVFIGDRVTVYQNEGGGPVWLGRHVALADGVIVETGDGGSVELGDGSRLQTGCHVSAYKSAIRIGRDVGVGPGCRFYAHDHATAAGQHRQLLSKGPIVVGDGVWIGADAKVLSGVSIGAQAIVAAGAVVTRNVPGGATVAGIPARVVKESSELFGAA